MSRAACTAACECACACVVPATRSDSGGREGSPSTSCIMFDKAASTTASESRLGCERTPRDVWDENEGPGAAAPSPSAVMDEAEAGAVAEVSSGVSTAESNT